MNGSQLLQMLFGAVEIACLAVESTRCLRGLPGFARRERFHLLCPNAVGVGLRFDFSRAKFGAKPFGLVEFRQGAIEIG